MSSKYDSVKITVALPGEHYFFLSRYLLSRILTFCKVPLRAAEQISLDVKKQFVRSGALRVTQADLLRTVCVTMGRYGFSDQYVSLLPVILQFHMQSIPLVVLLAGGGSCGATTIAHQLASRLSCHHVLNTETLLDMACVMDGADEEPNTSEQRCDDHGSSRGDNRGGVDAACKMSCHGHTPTAAEAEQVQSRWLRQSQQVSRVAALEVRNAIDRGKVLIVEGTCLNLCALHEYWQNSYQEKHGAIVLPVLLRATPWARRIVNDCTKQYSVSPVQFSCPGEQCGGCEREDVQDSLSACTARDVLHMNMLCRARVRGVQIVPVTCASLKGARHEANNTASTNPEPAAADHVESAEGCMAKFSATPPSSSLSMAHGVFSSTTSRTEVAQDKSQSSCGSSHAYEVHMTHPTMLPQITDALHDLILERILTELSRRDSS